MLNRPGKRVASSRDRAERPATRHRLEDVTVHLAILPQRRNMGRGPTSERRGGQRHTKQRRLPVAPSGLPIGSGHRRVPAPHILADDQLGPKGDRLFRSAKNALEIAEILRKREVELHLMDMGGPVLNSSVSRLVFGILMMVANMEAERIGERTAAVKEHRRELGFYVGGPVPAGYVKTDDGRISKDAAWDTNLKLMKKMSRLLQQISKHQLL